MSQRYGFSVGVESRETGTRFSAHNPDFTVRKIAIKGSTAFFTLTAENMAKNVDLTLFLDQKDLVALHAAIGRVVNEALFEQPDSDTTTGDPDGTVCIQN